MMSKGNYSLSKKQRRGNIVSYAVLIIGALLVILPILWMFITALKDDLEIYQMNGRILPEAITATSFIRIWKDYDFVLYFRNSLGVTLVAVLISLVASTLTGYGATRFNFRGKNTFLSFILMTQMFPSIMLLVPFYKILSVYGLNNSLVGLCIVYVSFTIPFCSWMMVGYFRTIPTEIDESAAIDGASHLQTFWKIALPLLVPSIKSAAILSMVGSLKYFDLIYVMTGGGPGTSTELMATYMYKQSFKTFNMGYGSAVAGGMFILISMVSLITMKLLNGKKED